jgi:hypothetical protein
MRGFLRSWLASCKVPRVIDFSTALPREDNGKIFQRKLREPLLAGSRAEDLGGHSLIDVRKDKQDFSTKGAEDARRSQRATDTRAFASSAHPPR